MPGPNKIQQLEQRLAEFEGMPAAELRLKIDTLNELAWQLSDSDPNRAEALSEMAFSLADSPDVEGYPYLAGKAYSLRTRGYVNARHGDHSIGLSQLLEALDLIDGQDLEDCLADVLDGIGLVYFQVSNFPDALEVAYQQLAAAERLNDKRRLANAYNKFASVFYRIGDYEQSKDVLDRNLQIAEEIGDTRIECITHVNLSELLLLNGENELALEHAGQALHISRTNGYRVFEIYALHRLGNCYLEMGDGAKAISHLEKAVNLSRAEGVKATETLVRMTLGRAYINTQQLDQALACLHSGLSVAQSISSRLEESRGHKLLSEVYERKGEMAQALAEYQEYHAIKERLTGEETNQRIRVMQIAHETKISRHEAEIARLRTIELQQNVREFENVQQQLEQQVAARTAELRETISKLEKEIISRKQAEAEIKQMVDQLEQRVADRSRELAALYDMTILFTEPYSLRKVLEPALDNINRSVEGSGIAVHILSADKNHLQLSAQLSLRDWEGMQHVNLAPDFAAWLEEAESPVMLVKGTEPFPFLPDELLLPAYQIYFCAALRVRQNVIGTLSVYREDPKLFSVQNVSLLITMAEQLGVIIENQRLREQSMNMARVIERQRVARELHDSVTQQLYSLNLFARAGQDAAAYGDLEEVQLRLGQVEENALNALREMRLLLYQLRPLALESHSLASAVEERFDLVERRLGTKATVQVDIMPVLADEVEEELFYIISEALNNVLKHAQASEVKVVFSTANNQLLVTIQDNGRGFDASQPYSGLGLENICLRTEKIGGLVKLETAIGQGTTIRLHYDGI